MINTIIYLGHYLHDASIVGYRKLTGSTRRSNSKFYREMMSDKAANDWIRKKLGGGEPFAVGRLGASETFNFNEYYAVQFHLKKHMNPKYMHALHNNSGFFPETEENVKKFCELFLSEVQCMDMLPTYRSFMEEYTIKNYARKDVIVCQPHAYEPYYFENPWSMALAGKKVLVVSPFVETIERQYKNNREKLFANPNMLPEFDLKTVKAVQTIAGNSDDRFKDWFEALDYMYDEAMKLDFEVALVGCGVYALPLSAMLKRAGKKVIMMCGSTQYLFGVKSARADATPALRELYNEYWCYPSQSEKPKNAEAVEGGCYWK